MCTIYLFSSVLLIFVNLTVPNIRKCEEILYTYELLEGLVGELITSAGFSTTLLLYW